MNTLSPDGIVEEFLDRWRNSDLPEKMPEPMVIANGPLVELTLITVHGPHQDKGYASLALRMLTALCDENGATLSLVARPMGPDCSLTPCGPARLSTDQLVAWYKRHGFVETSTPGDDTHSMIRKPQTDLIPESPRIRIGYLNPDGSVTKGRYLEELFPPIPSTTESNADPYIQALEAAGESEPDLRTAITALLSLPGSDEKRSVGLRSFWYSTGLHLRERLKGECSIFLDALRHLSLPYKGPAVTLYRGELAIRHEARAYGFAWTSDPGIARTFADRLTALKEGPSVLLRIEATPEMIIADPGQLDRARNEAEYIVDSRLVREVTVVPKHLYEDCYPTRTPPWANRG
jgi:hypothetical protein